MKSKINISELITGSDTGPTHPSGFSKYFPIANHNFYKAVPLHL
jgi:hypothetical protein